MDKHTATRPASVAQTISLLMEISRLDTLHRDLYFRRAHELMEPMLSQGLKARARPSSSCPFTPLAIAFIGANQLFIGKRQRLFSTSLVG